jgi:magnesium-protoporphyrin IX monomethyl ester (oxidative) cyclase
MKILLLNPPVPETYYTKEFYLPSGLLYLAAAIKDAGSEVALLDLKCTKYQEAVQKGERYQNIIVSKIRKFAPELIGIGCLFSGNFPSMLHYSQIIKKIFPNVHIVIGGIHPTIYAHKILEKCPSIDSIILGEGEDTIVKLVQCLEDDQSKHLEDIDGLAYRKDNSIIINPKKYFIDNIDTISFPAYDLVRMDNYFVDTSDWHNPKKLPIHTSVPIISSRSCPNRCNFCSMYQAMGPRWRPRTAENVVDEIEHIYKTYNLQHFSFMDDNFSLNKRRTLAICQEILSRKLDIQFETPNGLAIATLDEEVLDAMVQAGLVRISLAIESGSDFIRNKIMRKRLSRERIYDVLRLTQKYPHLYVRAFFIMGMPEETIKTLEKTYQMIKDIDVDRIYLSNVVPFPGTEVFEQASRDHLLLDLDPDTLYKSDALYLTNYDRIFVKPYDLELEELRKFRARCDELIARKKRLPPYRA